MNISTTQLKQIVLVLLAVPVLALVGVSYFQSPAQATASADDIAAMYKTQCLMCHGAKGEKKFDLTKTDEQHIDALIKGRPAEKPNLPKMQSYEKKMTPEQMQAMVTYMRQLRAPPAQVGGCGCGCSKPTCAGNCQGHSCQKPGSCHGCGCCK